MKTRTAKTSRISRSFIAYLSRSLALATLGTMGLGSAQAVDYNWDPDQTGTTLGGGGNTWNLLDTSWFDAVGATNVAWPNLNTDRAIFGNTGGTVLISTGAGVIANGLTFNSGGYTISGASAADVLTLDGATPTISVVGGANTATINAVIAGTVGFTKSGAGTLLLNSSSTGLTGGVSLTGGTTRLGLVDALGSNDVTVGTGALLETNLNAPVLTNGIILNGGAYRYGGVGQNSITALKAINLTGNGTIELVNAGVNGKLLLGAGQLVSSAATTLTKTGNGVLQLSGANAGFQSDVAFNAGLIEFQNVDALGTGTQTITVGNGAEFVSTGIAVRHNFTLNNGAVLSANGAGGADYAGTVTVNGSVTVQPRQFQGPTVATGLKISGSLAGTGTLNVAGVNPSLQGVGTATGFSNVYLTGNNTLFGGSFNLGVNGRITTTGAVDSLGAQTVNFNGGTLAIAPDLSGLSGSGLATAGLFGRYYNNGQLGSALSGGFDFGLSTPAATRTDTTINFGNFLTGGLPAGPANTNLGISWAGVMKVTTGGVYSFNTNSDDGSMLYVDGVPVAANDIPQGPTTRGGSVTLSPGYHSIVIKYVQGGGGTTMISNYSGPDTGGATVVLGSAANVFTSNGTALVGSATIDNPLTVAAGQSGSIEAVGGNLTSTGTLSIGSNSRFIATGQTGAELVTQSGTVTIDGRANIQVGGTGQSLAFAAAGADLTISGDLNEATAGSSIVKTGGRTLTLSGAYNWTGSTTLAGGFLGLNKPLPAGALTIINNGLNNANNTGVIGSGTFALAGNVNVSGASAGTNTFSGIVDLGGAARTFTTIGQSNTVLSGVVSNGDIIKNGLGTMTLSGASPANTGAITVNTGKLTVSNADGLGSAATGTTVNAGGYLDVANVSIAEPLTLNGRGQPIPVTAGQPGATYTGALQGSGGFASTVTGTVTLGSNSAIGVTAGNMLTISGVISGTGFSLTKTQGNGTLVATNATSGGGGILKLTGANTYTGDTIIEGGSLQLGNASGVAIQSSRVQIGNNRDGADLTLLANEQMISGVTLDFGQRQNVGAKFQLNGFTQTVAAFANSDKSNNFIQNHENGAAGALGTLIVNNPSDTSFFGGIRDLNGVLQVTKQGAGTLTFNGNGIAGTGAATYTGATLVQAGKLKLTDTTAFNSPITLSGTGSLEFNMNTGRSLVYSKVLTDGGLGFTKTGKGNLALSGLNAVSGTVNVNEGTLNLTDAAGNVNPLPNAPIVVAAGAQVQMYGVTAVTTTFNNNITLNGLTQGGALSGSVVGGTPTNTFTGTLTLNATSNISTGWADKTMNWTGVITGAGGLVIDKLHFTQQPGIFNITNTGNNYLGSTTINTGTVQFTANALPSGNLKFGGTFGNGGNFGTGQYVLSATAGSTFTRALGTGANQVQFTGDGGGFTAIGAPATVDFGGAGATLDWQTSGGFDANSSLVMNMGTGANNAITVNNPINLNSGVRRIVDNTNNMTYAGVISGTAALILEGGGQHRFIGTGANTYTGLTTLSGGVLALNRTGGNAIEGDIQISSNVGGTRRVVYLGANEQIADTATLSFLGQNANNGDLRLFGFSETVGAIQDRSGGGVIEISETGDTGYLGVAINNTLSSTLTVGGSIATPFNGDSFYNGFLRTQSGGTGVLNLVKNGSGTLTISAGQQSGQGNASYNGTTTINAGSVVYNNLTTYNSAITVASGANVGYNTNVNQAPTNNQIISGAGNLVKSGTGTMILSGANAYSGLTTVNNGILQITGTTNASHAGTYTVNAGGILLVGNGAAAGILTANNAITVNAGGVAAFNRNNGYNFSGIISGTGDVQSRAGGAATILSGANDYSGATTLFPNATLTLAGNGASAGGLNVTQGSTLTLDFNLAGANAAGIIAATAPVNLTGGTLSITGSAAANTQTLGAVTLGTAALGGFVGLTPSLPGNAASNITLTSGAGGLNVNLGPISHVTGGTADIALPASGTVTTSGTAVGGIANGFTTTSAGTTWLAQDGGGVLTALATYGTDTFGAAVNTDVTTSGAGATTNSLRFNTASASTVTLTGANVIDSGGILMTSAVGANINTITGGSLAGSSTAGLTVIQNNTAGLLNIGSVIENNGGATGLTKAGAGMLVLSGVNTYSGPTVVSQGALVLTNPLANSTVTTLPAGTLVVGDGTGVLAIPALGVNAGSLQLNDGGARTISTSFNAAPNFNSVSNAINNGTTFQTGNFTKLGTGALTIAAPVLAGTFHARSGVTEIVTGGNVLNSTFSSIGLASGDFGTLTVKGAGRYTVGTDFNVGDQSGSAGVVNITEAGVANVANFFVGKSGTAAGVVNLSGAGTLTITGNTDRRIAGNTASDGSTYGAFKITAGTFNAGGGNFQPGAHGKGVMTFEGGTSNFGVWLTPGRYAGSSAVINMQGGVLNATGAGNRLIVGENGTGVLNVGVPGSSAPQYSAGQLFLTGGLSSGNAGGNGNTNLWYGGLINAATIGDHNANTADGTSTFNFHGGTIQARAASTTFFGGGAAGTFNGNMTNAYVYQEGAVIDSNSFAITIPQSLIAPTGAGLSSIALGTAGSGYQAEPVVVITGGGGTGATARALLNSSGVITGYQITNPGVGYTSAPTVSLVGGIPTVAGAPGAATTAANATTGGITKVGTGTLTLTGANTFGGATRVSGGTLALNYATNATVVPATSQLILDGGSLQAIAQNNVNGTTTFASTVLSGVGSVTSTLTGTGVQTIALGAITRNAGSAVNFANTGTINTITANTGTSILGGWAVFGGGNNWAVSAGNGVTAGNISALASYTANTWAAGNNTDMTTAGTVTNLTTNSVRFNTATPVTVTISGTDTITTGGVLITPTATAAATIFTGGTLATAANADLVVNHFGTGAATIASVIAANGTGGLVKAGPGALLLGNVTNTYNGNTVIGEGTLRLAGANNVHIPNGAGKGNVVINAGATLDINNFDEQINGLSGFGTVVQSTVPGGDNQVVTKTLTVGDNNVSSVFSGVLNNTVGGGTNRIGNINLVKTGTGILTLNNVVQGTNTGSTTISAGAIKIATPNALANNTVIFVNAASGLRFDTTIPTISALGGNQTFALQTTASSPLPNTAVQLTVGNNNNGANYSGALTGSGTLIKIGSGTQTLSGNNANTGGMVVNGGLLQLLGNNQAASGGLVVNSGGNVWLANSNSLVGSSGRNMVIANGGLVMMGSFTANPASLGFPSVTSVLNRIDAGSSGVLALTTDGSLQTPISENLDFSVAGGINVSLGAQLTGNAGLGTSNVQYTGVITPSGNTFRIGGGNGRLILPNSATLAGANNLILGGGNSGGQTFLTGAYGFTGSTLVNSGTVYVNNLGAGGAGSSIGAGSSAASNLVLNGGTLAYIGAGTSTDRLFTLSTTPSALDASGAGAVNFTNTGALGFLNSGNRTFTIQGQNTGANTIAAGINDSYLVAGLNGSLAHGVTTLVKNGNGTWVLTGNNNFSGGVTINNGVLQFNSAASIGANTVNGPASVLVQAGGAVALAGSLTTGIQATLNRVSPLSTGTVALTANSAEAINFDGGAGGAQLSQAYLGAYGNATYTGTLNPFGSIYRLGGGGGVLTMPSGGLTGPRQVLIGGGGPVPTAGAFNVANPGAGFYQNPNLNGNVVLGGSSDYSGGTIIQPGAILSATSVTALGSGPLKFQGGVYRAIDTTDITLASDGSSAREIRVGNDGQTGFSANVDVINGITTTFSKTFGIMPTLGSNQGQASFTKFGNGTLILANGINLGATGGQNNVATNSGTLVIERGTLSILANPTNYVGTIQVGSNAGGVATLKLGADNVFANTTAQYTSANVIDIYNGSKLDLNGFSDTIRNFRGMGSIVNTGAGSPTITVGTVAGENIIFGGNLVGNFTLKRVGNNIIPYGTGNNANGIELFNNYNPNFTGKLVADAGGVRVRADGTLGSTSEALVADKITLNNGGVLYTTGNPVALGANRGISIGSGGGTVWGFGSNSFIINGPVSGAGMLTVTDDTATIYLGSDSNTYAGGTTINSGAGGRGMLAIGAGGATGSLPAGDVFFNSAAGAARLYLFKSSSLSVPNTLNGPGLVLQIGAGTTTLSGVNNTGQTTFIGGGKLVADFSGGNQPIGAGTAVQVSAGTFEYKAPAGDNTARFGQIVNAAFGMPYNYVGGTIGDAVIQSTYGGSGVQNLVFSGFNGRGAGSTLNFVTSGGANGSTNSIGLTGGFQPNNAIGAGYYFGGSEFAAYDQNGFIRAVQGTDFNATPDNTVVGGRYLRLTAAQTAQPAVAVPGINLVGGSSGFALAASQVLSLNGNPSALLKSGGGTAAITGGAAAGINNSNQELIVRADSATDVLSIDVPISGTGGLTKSGNGQLTLTAANNFIGTTFINSGSVLVTGNGAINLGTSGSEVRIANAVGQTASVTIDSAASSIITGNTANALRVGEAGNATLTQSAGTVTAARHLVIGENIASSGVYNMSGGTLNVKTDNTGNYQLTVGRAGAGTMNISGNAVVNVQNGAQLQLAAGVVNPIGLQGLVANSGLSTGVGIVNQTGGTVNVATGNGTYQSNIFGGVVIGVDGAGTYTLNGGTLNTPQLGRGHGTATFNLGSATAGTSGTLRATANTLNVTMPINLTGTGADKGTIDTNSNDLTFTGALSGAGGFKKASTGVLNLLGAGSYSGGTDITGGSIVASGTSLGTGVVNVGSGSTLQVQGQQKGLLGSFYAVTTTGINPGVSTGSAAGMATQFTSLDNLNNFTNGKAAVAIESTAARGKVSVNYLDLGVANGNSALPPSLIALNNGANPFLARLDGKFNASVAGEYTFQTRSDDGSVLFINGQPVLDNNRSQGQTVRTGTIALTSGLHDITVGYYQGTGGGGFSVGVTQPGQGQSFTTGELNMSNDLLSFGSNDITVGGLAGAGTVNTVTGGTVTNNNSVDADFSGTLNGNAAFVKAGLGKQVISGNNAATFTGAVTVSGGNLEVSGSLSGSSVTVAGGTLGGDGAVGAVSVTSGTVAPGNSGIGSLDTANFGLTAGTLSLELNNTGAYDSINTAGTVTLGGNLSLSIGAGPFLIGDTFLVINNDGVDPVSGTFAGIAEGGLLSAGGFDFTVSYAGGDGNDVVLVVPEPGSAALLLGGLAMLAGRRRRDKRA